MKVKLKTEETLIKEKDFSKNCGQENSDISVEEVEAASDLAIVHKVQKSKYLTHLKKGGEAVSMGIHFIIIYRKDGQRVLSHRLSN